MTYRELLPVGCPPDAAEEIVLPRDLFRLVRSVPPAEGDFRSWRAEQPQRGLPEELTECQARGLSVYAERQDLERILKLPKFRRRWICRLRLGAGAGRIQQTGRPSHHTWWPLADFDILAQCRVDTA